MFMYIHKQANSEDLDELPHKAAFHNSLHCLQRDKNNLQGQKYIIL